MFPPLKTDTSLWWTEGTYRKYSLHLVTSVPLLSVLIIVSVYRSCVQMCRVSHCMKEINVAEGDRPPPCCGLLHNTPFALSKGKKRHKAVLEYSGSVLFTAPVYKTYTVLYTSPHRPFYIYIYHTLTDSLCFFFLFLFF